MNRLSLSQFVRRKCGISGTDATTVTASGEWANVVSAVDEAYEKIQTEREDWLFLRKSFSFVTVAEQGEYEYDAAPLSLTDFGSWVDDQFRIYKTSIANETWLLQYKDYDTFRNQFLIGSIRTQYSAPTCVVVSPSKSLILGLAPEDTSYTVSGYYWRSPHEMTLDADEPILPSKFHKIIAYKAIEMLGVNEVATELIDYYRSEYVDFMARMEREQLPTMTVDRSFL